MKTMRKMQNEEKKYKKDDKTMRKMHKEVKKYKKI